MELTISLIKFNRASGNMLFAKDGQTKVYSAFTILFNFCPGLTSNFQLYVLTSTKRFYSTSVVVRRNTNSQPSQITERYLQPYDDTANIEMTTNKMI